MADPIVTGAKPGGRRLLALGGAVLLVVAALAARSRLDSDDTGGAGGGGRGDQTLVCPPDLADVCEAAVAADGDLTVRIEDPLATTDALVAATSASAIDGDLWLVPAPWAEAIAAQRDRDRQPVLTGEVVGPIARSPVLLALSDQRAAALELGACDGEIQWKCVGEVTGRQWGGAVGGEATWGTVKAGLTDPTSAQGLPVLGAATAGYLGTAEYASNEISGPLLGWLGAFAAYPAPSNAVDMMLTEGPARYFAVGALEVTARKAVDRSGFRVVAPEPLATADLVVVPIGRNAEDGDGADDLAGNDDLLDALAEAGWRVDDHDLAPGVDADLDLPRGDGLPSGDVLRPLLSAWQDLA